jgi:hypothetical protein
VIRGSYFRVSEYSNPRKANPWVARADCIPLPNPKLIMVMNNQCSWIYRETHK